MRKDISNSVGAILVGAIAVGIDLALIVGLSPIWVPIWVYNRVRSRIDTVQEVFGKEEHRNT